MKFIATLSKDQPLDSRTLSGLGRFERGEGRPVDLTPEQAASLTGKGFDLESLEADEGHGEEFPDNESRPRRKKRCEKKEID